MKSYIAMFSDLYEALSRDLVQTFPTLEAGVERDLTRLRRALSHEGLGFITLTHLEMNAAFRQALAVGDLSIGVGSKPPRGFGASSSIDVRPKYLHGLMGLVFDEKGMLLQNPDTNAIAFISQWLLAGKKIELECSDERLEASLTDFVAIDAALPSSYPDTWDDTFPKWVRRTGHPLWGDTKHADASSDLFGGVVQDARCNWGLFRALCDRLRSQLGSVDYSALRPKHGRGAVADGDGLKYEFRHWPAKLQQIFPWDYYGACDLGVMKIALGREPDEREFPSVVLAVPKTQKGPRIICKEPIAHQWMQGAVERWLYSRVKDSFLRDVTDVKNQDISKSLALQASRSGEFATVDLSNASDRLSTRLVEYCLGGGDNSLLDALHACRSRYYVLANEMHVFRKFAPAGSACTFPIQSICFSLLSIFSIMEARGLGMESLDACASEVRVYGDDIIVPVDAYGKLCEILRTVGLKVNTSKSFATGLFRESCGMDAYDGCDITPAYVRRAYSLSDHTSLGAVVEASNNFFMKGYWHTAAAILKTVPEAERKLLSIGAKEGGAVTLFSYCGVDQSHLKSRWNQELHVRQHRAICISSKVTKVQSDGDAGLIQFFTEEPDPMSKYSSGQVQRTQDTKVVRWV